MNSSLTDIDSLSVIPFLNNPDTIASLKTELPIYLAKSDAVDPNVNILEWWKDNEEDLPNWSSAAKVVPGAAESFLTFKLLFWR